MHDERLAAWIAASDILPNEVADVFLRCFDGEEETQILAESHRVPRATKRVRRESVLAPQVCLTAPFMEAHRRNRHNGAKKLISLASVLAFRGGRKGS